MSVKNKLGTLVLIILTIFTVHRIVGAKYYSVDLVLVSTVFSLFFTYQIVAFLFGWPMMTNTISLEENKHNILRLLLFLLIILMWLSMVVDA